MLSIGPETKSECGEWEQVGLHLQAKFTYTLPPNIRTKQETSQV